MRTPVMLEITVRNSVLPTLLKAFQLPGTTRYDLQNGGVNCSFFADHIAK